MDKPVIKSWKDINPGGVIESGTSEYFHTGDWRTNVPVWQSDNCIQCMTCWAFCPDDAIHIKIMKNEKTGKEEAKRADYNYDFCKGCGICAEECPVNNKIVRGMLKENPDKKIDPVKGHGEKDFDERASIVMVPLKEAKEKYNIK